MHGNPFLLLDYSSSYQLSSDSEDDDSILPDPKSFVPGDIVKVEGPWGGTHPLDPAYKIIAIPDPSDISRHPMTTVHSVTGEIRMCHINCLRIHVPKGDEAFNFGLFNI